MLARISLRFHPPFTAVVLGCVSTSLAQLCLTCPNTALARSACSKLCSDCLSLVGIIRCSYKASFLLSTDRPSIGMLKQFMIFLPSLKFALLMRAQHTNAFEVPESGGARVVRVLTVAAGRVRCFQ